MIYLNVLTSPVNTQKTQTGSERFDKSGATERILRICALKKRGDTDYLIISRSVYKNCGCSQ
jgi:hypothetical protein